MFVPLCVVRQQTLHLSSVLALSHSQSPAVPPSLTGVGAGRGPTSPASPGSGQNEIGPVALTGQSGALPFPDTVLCKSVKSYRCNLFFSFFFSSFSLHSLVFSLTWLTVWKYITALVTPLGDAAVSLSRHQVLGLHTAPAAVDSRLVMRNPR